MSFIFFFVYVYIYFPDMLIRKNSKGRNSLLIISDVKLFLWVLLLEIRSFPDSRRDPCSRIIYFLAYISGFKYSHFAISWTPRQEVSLTTVTLGKCAREIGRNKNCKTRLNANSHSEILPIIDDVFSYSDEEIRARPFISILRTSLASVVMTALIII